MFFPRSLVTLPCEKHPSMCTWHHFLRQVAHIKGKKKNKSPRKKGNCGHAFFGELHYNALKVLEGYTMDKMSFHFFNFWSFFFFTFQTFHLLCNFSSNMQPFFECFIHFATFP
jgi:hypothetical protein